MGRGGEEELEEVPDYTDRADVPNYADLDLEETEFLSRRYFYHSLRQALDDAEEEGLVLVEDDYDDELEAIYQDLGLDLDDLEAHRALLIHELRSLLPLLQRKGESMSRLRAGLAQVLDLERLGELGYLDDISSEELSWLILGAFYTDQLRSKSFAEGIDSFERFLAGELHLAQSKARVGGIQSDIEPVVVDPGVMRIVEGLRDLNCAGACLVFATPDGVRTLPFMVVLRNDFFQSYPEEELHDFARRTLVHEMIHVNQSLASEIDRSGNLILPPGCDQVRAMSLVEAATEALACSRSLRRGMASKTIPYEHEVLALLDVLQETGTAEKDLPRELERINTLTISELIEELSARKNISPEKFLDLFGKRVSSYVQLDYSSRGGENNHRDILYRIAEQERKNAYTDHAGSSVL